MGFLRWGRGTGFNSKYNQGKWDFVAKEQAGSQWMENYCKETLQVSGVLAKLT